MVDPGGPSLDRLVEIMARLRDPETGCPWDIAQDFASIAPFTIEEAYEVADAIERDDMAALMDELGDLQLQVVYHAQMAAELGTFSISDVITAICDKMVRRHPHVFGNGETIGWESIKAAERAAQCDPSALAGVARALPALLRADKLQRRAARTGFDWPDPQGARDKIVEEIAEVDAATDDAARIEEIGDLLFSVVNFARHLSIDPEAALRAANAKFERRFRAMETLDADFEHRSLDAKETLWQRVKADER